MSKYNLFDVATDNSLFDSFEDHTYRRQTIYAISNLRTGNGFNLYYERFILSKSGKQKKVGRFEKNDFRKFYISENYMENVIGKFTSYMPRLRMKTDIDEKIIKLVNKSLIDINWEAEVYDAICDTMEAKGDVYLAIYFDNEDDKLPKLRALKSENMIDIIVDENDVPIAYVYDDISDRVGRKINPSNGEVEIGETITTRLIFTKGKVVKYRDGQKLKEIPNNKCIIDDIPLIHIQADKKEGNVFSNIPAKYYIEDVLHIDKCTTLISQTLEYQGFSLKHLIDGVIDGNSRPVPGGYMSIKTDKKTVMRGLQAKVVDSQLNNELKANFEDKDGAKSALYEKAKLIAPSVEQIVGKTDSGKVFQHFRLPLQTKVRKYRDNIIDGMTLWFKALLCSNDLYTDDIKGLSFLKDVYVIETSTDEKLLNQQLELAGGTKTVEIVKAENGDSKEDTAKALAEIKRKEVLENERNDTKNVEKT